jgi:hypothetical protein
MIRFSRCLPGTAKAATVVFCLVTAVLTLNMPLHAEFRGIELLWRCSSEEPDLQLACVGYLSGFMDGVEINATATKGRKSFCLPKEGISNDQARRILVKWLEARPKFLHESARVHVLLALKDAFPCAE